MRWGMGLLVAACLVTGLAPSLLLAGADPVVTFLTGMPPHTLAGALVPGTLSGVAAAAAPPPTVLPAAILAALAAAGVLALSLRRGLGGAVRLRRAPTWACGNVLIPRNEYTPASFSKPLRIIFAWAVRPFRHTDAEYAPDAPPYFVRTMFYRAGTTPVIERALYRRAVALLVGASHRLRRLQTGSLRLYLAYMLAALVVLLVWGR
jgi:hydrogenase-4 component B